MTHTKDIKIILLRDLETEKCTFKQIFASIIQTPKKCENFGWKGNFLSEKKNYDTTPVTLLLTLNM